MVFHGGGVLLFFLALIRLHAGRAQEDDFRLFVADAAGYIHMLDSDLNLYWQYIINSQVIGVTVDPDSTHDDHTIVYSTMSSDIRELFIETEKNVRLFDFSGSIYVDRMVMEPISQNIYYTGVSWPYRGYSYVGVISTENENKKLIPGLYEPRDIILDHNRRKLYYTDHGATADESHIGWAYLDGSEVDILIGGDLNWPSGLAIDHTDDILYWSDALRHSIERYDLISGSREPEVWLQFSVDVMPMDILIDGEFMYYVQYTLPNVTKLRMNDKQVVMEKNLDVLGLSRLDALAIYSSNTRDQLTGISGCSERGGLGDCSNICLPSKEGRTCACADDHELVDETTCDNAQQCPVDFTHGYVDVESCRRYNRDECTVYCVEGAVPMVETITCIKGEWDTRIAPCESINENYRMFVTDAYGHVFGIDTEGNVLQTYNVLGRQDSATVQPVGIAVSPHATSFDMDFVFSTLEPYNYYGYILTDGYIYMMNAETQTKTMIFDLNEKIAGGSLYYEIYADRFAVEPVTKNIYFTVVVKERTATGSANTASSLICVLSQKGDFAAIIGGMSEPRDIVLHPTKRLLFWTDHYFYNETNDLYPSIGQAYLDGTDARPILSRLNTGGKMTWPNGLAVDTKNDYLYWSDGATWLTGQNVFGATGRINRYSINDGTNEELFSLPNSQLMDIMIDGAWLYYLDWKNVGMITKVNLGNLDDKEYILIPDAQRLDAITLFSPNTHEIIGSTECAKRDGRGDCSHICTTNSAGQSCLCDYGVAMAANGKTCANSVLCAEVVDNGKISNTTCLRHDGEECETLCDNGYSPVLSKIKCVNGAWNVTDNCRKDCNDIPSLGNGQVVLTRGNAHGSEASFKCNIGYKVRSEVARKCGDGKWSNDNPVCDSIECDEPPSLENGNVNTPNGRTYLKMAEYKCSTGYILEGASKRMCSMNGQWEGTTPSCKIVECSPLDDPQFGSVTSTGREYEANATYSCQPGFEIEGEDTATCKADGEWSSVQPICNRILCVEVLDLEHGYMEFPDIPEYESEVEFSCEPGFVLNGPTVSTCTSHGNWTEKPVCDRIQCGSLDSPQYGSVTSTGKEFEAIATYSCQLGFEIEGAETATCKAEGEWSPGPPTCNRIKCGSLDIPQYGSVTSTGEEFEAIATYSCQLGFEIEGAETATCKADGEWSPGPPNCNRIICLEVLDLEHGYTLMPDPAEYESEVQFVCDSGFVLNGPESATCEWDRNWTEQPVCERILCVEVLELEHGYMEFPDIPEYESEVEFSCEPGFVLNGPTVSTCTSHGNWTEKPVCDRIQCDSLDSPQYGSVTSTGEEFEAIATYSCQLGFEIEGAETATCKADGEWSTGPPTCNRIKCGSLDSPQYGSVTSTGEEFEAIATYSCQLGFEIEGAETATCKSDGEWIPGPPTCNRIKCGSLDSPQYGSVTSTGEEFEAIGTYSCQLGFEIEGAETATCKADGEWSPGPPTCNRIKCGSLDSPQYGSVTSTGEEFEAIGTYSCQLGFEIEGAETATCKADGEWSPGPPTCNRIKCGPLVDPEDGSVSTTGVVFESEATYSCNTGFYLKGTDTAVCTADREWSPEPPTCKRNKCPVISANDHGSVDFTEKRFYGSNATFSCDIGFTLGDQANPLTCQANKTWSADVPNCQRVECPDIKAGDHSSETFTDDRFYESIATFSCEMGFTIGDQTNPLICQANKEWSGVVPSCEWIEITTTTTPPPETTAGGPVTTPVMPTTTLDWPDDLGSTGSTIKPGIIAMLTLLLTIVMM